MRPGAIAVAAVTLAISSVMMQSRGQVEAVGVFDENVMAIVSFPEGIHFDALDETDVLVRQGLYRTS